MKTQYLKNGTLLALLIFASALSAQTYYGAISPEASTGQLDILETSTGASVSSTAITMTGLTVNGITGMAHDASTNTIYVLVKHDTVISLAQINLITGVLSNLVGLSEKFAGLTITPNGTAYGVTGDGANTSETIYEIDLSNGNLTLNTQPGVGFDGEALAYNTSDGLLYRFGGGQIFQSIDPMNSTVTDISLSHDVDNYAHALHYNAVSDNFLFAAGDSLYELATNGVLTGIAEITSNNDGYKGLLPTTITGIDEVLQKVKLNAYPNPTDEFLTLSGLGNGLWQHEVIDPLGRVVKTMSTLNDQAVIDLSDLRSGHYAIVSRNEEQKAITPIVIE